MGYTFKIFLGCFCIFIYIFFEALVIIHVHCIENSGQNILPYSVPQKKEIHYLLSLNKQVFTISDRDLFVNICHYSVRVTDAVKT